MEELKRLPSEENEELSKGQKMSRWRKETLFIMLFVSNMFAFTTFGLIAPLFPTEASAKGVSYTLQGWIFGSYALTQCITSPLIGAIIPYIGFRCTYITGILFVSIWNILFGFLPWIEDKYFFIIGSFVCRIGMACGVTAINNSIFVIITMTWPQDIGFRVGTIETAMGIGTMIGPTLAGKFNFI